ncbi:hypothetical protein B7494_g5035 [Chlorociboria aeruginascens]|nr:hypothetical protein B7494_g5035 [Chlorociboria aeruginascens]
MASTFTPAGSSPPGIIPNPNNPTNTLYPEIVATVTLSIVLTTFFTAARLVAKRATANFSIEDYFSIAAWVMFIGYAATFMLQGQAGIGRHIWDIRISWAILMMFCVINWIAKTALILQMQRTFSPTRSGPVYIACQSLIWINLAFYTATFISLAVECMPTKRIWDPLITSGYCINTGALLISMGVISVVSDLTILILPIWAIHHLRMSRKLKLGISAIFATGLLAFACSICRMAYTFPPLHSEDSTYLYAPVGLWSIAELASIILCTSFPLMPRFVQVMKGKSSSSQSTPQNRYAGYGASGSSSSGRIPSRKAAIGESAIKEEDEEHLYPSVHGIQKTIDIEMRSYKKESSGSERDITESGN